MQVDYISDIHINWHVKTQNPLKFKLQVAKFIKTTLLPRQIGDVLIIAGDISERNVYTKMTIEAFTKYYDHVIFLFGNHDYYLASNKQTRLYQYDSRNRAKEIKAYFADNPKVHILDNDVIEIGGKTFAGTSNWYQATTPEGRAFYQNESNDSRYIWVNGHTGTVPMVTLSHRDAEFYEELVASRRQIDVMVSHVPPIQPPNPEFAWSENYVHPVATFVAPHWVCGHQHVHREFENNGVVFHINPYGYEGSHDQGIKSFNI